MAKPPFTANTPTDEQAVKNDLFRFLVRNYYVTSHLVERLDDLKGAAIFDHLDQAFSDTIIILEAQLAKNDRLFAELNIKNADVEPMIALLENVFTNIQAKDNPTPCIAMLDYISLADCIMEQSAKMAEFSLAQQPDLILSSYDLYDAEALQPLKLLLEETCLAV